MTWLITGGAGYIGAHVAQAMAKAGEPIVVFDDLSDGRADRVPEGVPLVNGSVLDRRSLDGAFRQHQISAVVHIAAKKQVGESVADPLTYYRENIQGLHTLLEATVAAGVRRFVFSSSAAVYGLPDVELVTEHTPCAPINPYGQTKLAGEWLVRATGRAHGIGTVSLRYFNVAGASSPELSDVGVSNLVPMVFERLSAGRAPVIFGDDYPTEDGTCERDYIHVADVALAHLAAARWLTDQDRSHRSHRDGDPVELTVNVGRGVGVSVRTMIEQISEVTGHAGLRPTIAGRRAGDPARVVASADLAAKELAWSAQYDIRDMIESAWQGWRLHHPDPRP